MKLLADLIYDNPKATLAIWMLLVVAAGTGALKLTVSSDNRVFYSENNKQFLQLREFEEKYIANNNIVFMISGREGRKTNEIIPEIEWLSEKAWDVKNVSRVDSLASYTLVHSSSDSALDLGTALETPCLQTGSCRLEDLPVNSRKGLVGRLIGKEPNVYAVLLTLNLDIKDTTEIQKIMDGANQLKQEFKQTFPDTAVNFTGGIPMMAAFSTAAERDSATLIPATLLILFLVCWWCLDSYKMAGVLLLFGITSTAFTMGLAGYYGLVLNTATAIASIVIITLVVATSMHYASSYLNDSLIYPPEVAAHNALKINLKPILLTTATSALGFLSMLYADAPPIGELGVLAATGLAFGAIQVLLIGPIICRSVQTKHKPTPSQTMASFVAREKPYNRYWVLGLLAIAAASMGTFSLKINDDFVSYFDHSFEFRTQTDLVSHRLSGPNHIELDVLSSEVDGIFESSYLASIRKLSNFLRSQDLVSNTYSLDDIFLELEPLADKPIASSSGEEAAQLYLAYELSLAYGQSSSDFVDQFRQSSRISILLNNSTSAEIRNLIDRIQQWSAENISYEVVVTGENVPVSNLTRYNFAEMMQGIAISLVVAGLLVAFFLKSVRLALICFFCTITPVIAGLGIWGLVLGEIGLAAVVLIAITLGIVIDDAIHIVSRYDHYRRQDPSPSEDTTSKTIRLVSGAVISTTGAMVVGFSALMLSGFGINSTLGACTALILSLALLVDLIILPKLLQKFS